MNVATAPGRIERVLDRIVFYTMAVFLVLFSLSILSFFNNTSMTMIALSGHP